ncbi:MAG TPA: transposase [Planctomycetota bacterium]|nr:transposase [Planctomycetota bacterium]
MTRYARFSFDGALHHVTMRCNNKEFLFDTDSFGLFISLLGEISRMYGLPLYGYCLMTNHVHLLVQVDTAGVISLFMQRLANTFARQFNSARRRKGHLWEARFRSCIVEADAFLLRAMAYVDLNPVRAGIAENPSVHPWSGHAELASGNKNLLTFHQTYAALGSNSAARYEAFQRILAQELARPAYSLAETLFVGRAEFVQEMMQRFGIESRVRPRVRWVDLGDGAWALQPLGGGGVRGVRYRRLIQDDDRQCQS